jgi:hypothetical protein
MKSRPQPLAKRTLGGYRSSLTFQLYEPKSGSFEVSAKDLTKGEWTKALFSRQGYDWHVGVLRMYPSEMSARLSTVTNLQDLSIFADVTASHYFENLGWGNHDSFLTHRIGTRIKAFRSLTPLATGRSSEGVDVNAFTAEVRFDLKKGLWNFDEKIGLLSGFSDIGIGDTRGQFVPIGFYWARTLPRIFDDILNTVPMFRHPKYVDMDFSYLGFDNQFRPTNPGYVLNLHGKMMFSKTWFFELGYGWTRLDLRNEEKRRVLDLYSMTSGFGLLF